LWMNALLTSRGHRFLPLLAMGCVLFGLPQRASAGMFNSRLTDRPTLALAGLSTIGLTARVVYESQGEKESKMHEGEQGHPSPLAALMLTLIIPAGTVADSPSPPPPPPPPPPPQQTTSTPPPTVPPGGGVVSSTPEPGALLLALTGGGTAMLTWLRRRRAVNN
jgi:hypothetical protein